MIYKKLSYILCISLSVFSIELFAQDSFNTAGGETSGLGGNTSYILGQVMYTTITSGTGSVSQGTGQPYEISTITSVDETANISITATVHPNPTSGIVKLNLLSEKYQGLTAYIYNQEGTIVSSQKVENKETLISLAHVPPSVYLLKIIKNQTEVKSFKIVKNQ